MNELLISHLSPTLFIIKDKNNKRAQKLYNDRPNTEKLRTK
jgi:hypothetical protein